MGPDLTDPDRGQIFRTRPQKYRWAPDTYVAFLMRNGQADMAVSRDGVQWKICSDHGFGYYLSAKSKMEGREIGEGTIANGMIRRGDRIWQYANCRVAGVGTGTYRVEQRLDGFMSLDAGERTGTVITRPMVFEGNRLTLNVVAEGSVKVGILNLPGRAMSGYHIGLTDAPKTSLAGFGVDECDPIRGDSVRQVVSWKGNNDVGNLAGQVVRLRFEMEKAKLYAFQFEE
jgi:hypothetical protein